MAKSFVYVEGLAKHYAGARGQPTLTVFENLTFGINKGELVTMIGHSGCGKSTVLDIMAGLGTASAGYVFVNDRAVTAPSISRGVVFQNHSLLPWKTALANVAFSVRARWPAWSRAQIRAHSLRYLHMVGLRGGAEHRRPAQLSGGMRQRVGIARAFAIQPEVLLLDEPFGALDALTRATVQDELLAAWRGSGLTVFMITHDIDEAIYLSDRVLLMTEGPHARLAEDVRINLPRPRERASLLKDPRYYELRARLVDFLHRRPSSEGDSKTETETASTLAQTKEIIPHDQERDERRRARGEEGKRTDLGEAG